MRGEETEHKARPAIHEQGLLFQSEAVRLMEEAAGYFVEQGLALETLGREGDYLRVRVIPGPGMRELTEFWSAVWVLEMRALFEEQGLDVPKQLKALAQASVAE